MLYKRRRCSSPNVWGILQRCLVVLELLLISTSNSVVEGFRTLAYSSNARILLNPGSLTNTDLTTVEGTTTRRRSATLQAESVARSTSFRIGAFWRIRRSSTRLNNNADSAGDSDASSSSPYWFAKVKTPPPPSSAEGSQRLARLDIPKEDTPIAPPQQSQQDSPIPPQQAQRLQQMRQGTLIPPQLAQQLQQKKGTFIMPPQQTQLPRQSSRPNSPFSHSQAGDSSWTDIATPVARSVFKVDTPIAPQIPQPTQRLQPIRPNSPLRHSNGADSRWTDVATPVPKVPTSRQPASGSGFMPIFGAVPEVATPVPAKEKRVRPKGASDQERDLSEVDIQTEQKPKGASDQERDLSKVNLQTEPPQARTPTLAESAPPSSTTDDTQQPISPSNRPIKVHEIDDEDEEYDDDNSVAPIILEYMSIDNNEYMQTIVFPFRVDSTVRSEEHIGRQNDAPMFTPSVKADIYKVLRSPNDPKAGAEAPPSGPPKKALSSSSPFAAILLAKLDEGTYAFCDRSLYDSREEQRKTVGDSSSSSAAAAAWDKLSQYTPLDDEQMLKAVACIGQTSPNALAITKAFEAYLSQKAWAWGDYQATAFSVEFLIAFGNELSTRLDINHRIRSQKLNDEELAILSKPPFCNYVQPDMMRIFQDKWHVEEKQKKKDPKNQYSR